jgi:hypothetical protein
MDHIVQAAPGFAEDVVDVSKRSGAWLYQNTPSACPIICQIHARSWVRSFEAENQPTRRGAETSTVLEETKHMSTRGAELLVAAGGRIKEALPGVAEDAKDLLGRSSAWVREKAPELAANAGTDAANAGEDTGSWLWRQVSLRHKAQS